MSPNALVLLRAIPASVAVALFATASLALEPRPSDRPAYPVSELIVHYEDPNPQFPTSEDMQQVEVELAQVTDGYVAPRADAPVVRMKLSDIRTLGTPKIYASALRAINQQLVFEFNRRDFYAIVVSPLPDEIEKFTGRDLRPEGQTKLRLGVYAGRVRDLETYAAGYGAATSDEQNTNREDHAWILKGSPLQPGTDQDLVRKDRLDAYLARLNRHPSRRIDADLKANSRFPGSVTLTYAVAENKPWWAYTQVEDTGTKETTRLRERFGFVHSDVSGRDDIFQVDYVTGNFDEVHAFIASYETPFERAGRVRARGFATWSQYDASVLGFKNKFQGEQYSVGLQAIANVLQSGELFIDAVVGAQWEGITVDNESAAPFIHQNAGFAIGLAGLRAERLGRASTLRSELSVLHSFAGNAAESELENLGRLSVDEEDFTILRWDLQTTFFLAPLFSPRSWRDPSYLTTRSLAHEAAFSFRGQYAFDERLIPQQEQVAGGLYSVRGYPESVAVGDNVEVASLEYRLHVPRLLRPSDAPMRLPGVGAFQARPRYEYSFPDWDFVVKAFVDAGHVDPVDGAANNEKSNTLVGAGVGVELRFRRFVTARVDYGVALLDAEELDLGGNSIDVTDRGDDQVHFSVTLLY